MEDRKLIKKKVKLLFRIAPWYRKGSFYWIERTGRKRINNLAARNLEELDKLINNACKSKLRYARQRKAYIDRFLARV